MFEAHSNLHCPEVDLYCYPTIPLGPLKIYSVLCAIMNCLWQGEVLGDLLLWNLQKGIADFKTLDILAGEGVTLSSTYDSWGRRCEC